MPKKSNSRENLKINAEIIREKTSSKILIANHYPILRALGIGPIGLPGFHDAILTLKKVCSFSNIDTIQVLSASLFHLFTQNETDHFLEKFPLPGSSHKSGDFKVDNDTFKNSPIYWLFSGVDDQVRERFTADIDLKNINYHPIATFGLLAITHRNLVNPVDKHEKGLSNLAENLKLLMTNPSWKVKIEEVISSYFNCQKEPIDQHLSHFLEKVYEDQIPLRDLNKNQELLLNKLAQLNHDNPEILAKNASTLDEDSHPSSNLNKNNQTPQTSIYRTPTDLDNNNDKDEDESEEENLSFHSTVGTWRSEIDAQNILSSNEVLLPEEVESVENSIYDEDDNAIDDSTKLCRALNLYYSIPLNHISSILIGTPGLDFLKNEMDNRIVIDIANDLIHLPTPIQRLNQTTDEHYIHDHLPLILESNTKSLLLRLINTNNSTHRLKDYIDEKSLKNANSFKHIQGFKLHRITEGKVSKVLCSQTLHACHDEVKTAYIQGGAYNFIHMGCYYTKLEIDNLNQLFIDTCKTTFSHCSFSENHKLPSGTIGTTRVPKIDKVNSFINQKWRQLNNLKKSIKSPDDLWTFHNALTLYTITVLNLSTTHRPHLDPYYSIENFIDDRFVQITEKVIMKGFEGRLCVLSHISLLQFKEYLKHINYITQSLSDTSKKLFTDITNRKSDPKNGTPLFFLVFNNKLQPITKNEIREYLCSIVGIQLPENFYRHLFSSYFAKINTPRQLIATQMGHISKGAEPYASWSQFSPTELYNQLAPLLDSYFTKELDIKIISSPFPKSYKPMGINVMCEKRMLGPYARKALRKANFSDTDIEQLDLLFFENAEQATKSKLFINRKTQKNHLSILKSQKIKNPHKTLEAYYQNKKRKCQWKVETFSSIEKSLFGPSFPRKYHAGKTYFNKINSILLKSDQNSIQVNSREARCLLALSAIISGTINQKDHLIEIANSNKPGYQDIRFSKAIELNGLNKKTHRTWILNSISIIALEKITDIDSVIDENNFDITLELFELPKLRRLISCLKAYHLIHLPSSIINWTSKPEMQNSIGVQGYKNIAGDYTDTNYKTSQNNFNIDTSNWKNFQVISKNNSDDAFTQPEAIKRVKQLSSALSQYKSERFGPKEALQKLHHLKHSDNFTIKTLPEQLLLEWVEHELSNQRIVVSSIATYFSKIYQYIFPEFIRFASLDDLDDEVLFETIYPRVLKRIDGDYADKSTDRPYPALSSFHQYLASCYGFENLHFSARKVSPEASIQHIITEPQYQACLDAISQMKIDEELKIHLMIALILYKRLGLRKYEVFKLQVKDIFADAKMVHIHGNHIQAEKSNRGNRLLPYDKLLTAEEVKILERCVNTSSLNTSNSNLLFEGLIQIYSRNSVQNRITSFLTMLVRSITRNQNLSIKSFRKSFASEILIQLGTSTDFRASSRFFEAQPEYLNDYIHKSFNQKSPSNLYWLVANLLGHTTPNTSFEHYTLTKDLLIFFETEKNLEQETKYSSVLNNIASKNDLTVATIKNLNRYKLFKFCYLHGSKLTILTHVPFKINTPHFEALFSKKVDIETLQKNLLVYANGDLLANEVDNQLLLTQGTTNALIKGIKSLIKHKHPSQISDALVKKMIIDHSRFELKGNSFKKKQLPQITAKTINNLIKLDDGNLKILQEIWRNQFTLGRYIKEELIIQSRSELTRFLSIYQTFNAHELEESYLNIDIIGTRNLKKLVAIEIKESYIEINDYQKIEEDGYPLENFILKISYRNRQAKKRAFCPFGISTIIFWASIYKILAL